jgi:hypothetical protein
MKTCTTNNCAHTGDSSCEAETVVVAKEWGRMTLQENLDKQLRELNIRLQQKEVSNMCPFQSLSSEMKTLLDSSYCNPPCIAI